MLMCSFVHFYFVCEHLFTFQFCALVPKISKENFAKLLGPCLQTPWHPWRGANLSFIIDFDRDSCRGFKTLEMHLFVACVKPFMCNFSFTVILKIFLRKIGKIAIWKSFFEIKRVSNNLNHIRGALESGKGYQKDLFYFSISSVFFKNTKTSKLPKQEWEMSMTRREVFWVAWMRCADRSHLLIHPLQ